MATTKVQSELIVDDVALAGNPTTSTQSAGNNTTRIATTAFVTTAVDNLIASAPGTMDTLNEIAAALGDDPSFTTTVNNAIALKAPLASPALTGTVTAASHVQIAGNLDVVGQIGAYDNPGSSWGTMGLRATDYTFKNAGGTVNLTIAATGSVLIGQDSGDSFNSDSMLRIQRAGDRVFQQFKCDADQNIQILFGDVDDDVECSIQYYPANKNLVFATGNNNDALTLDSSQNASFVGNITCLSANTDFTISGDSSTNTYLASNGQIRIRPEGTSVNKIILDSSYVYAPLFTTANGTAGIGVSLGDTNDAELGPGYLTLARDDTADADQILLMKNGNLHTKMQTIANAFVIHADGSDIHFRTNEGGTSRKINFSGSIPSFKPFDSDNNAIDLGTSGARWRDLYLRDDILIGNAPATGCLASAGIAIASGAVGSNALNGCLSMTGTGGDFYAENWTTSQANSNGAGFGRLAAFSPSTDYLVMQYRTGGSSTNIMFQHASGNVTVSGTLSDSSDRKLKKNIADLPSQLEKVKQLKPVSYTRKSNDNEEIGFIAQDVEALYTELVNTEQQPTGEMGSDGNPENEDIKVLAYGRLTAVLTKALQEQQVIIDDLKSRIEALEG